MHASYGAVSKTCTVSLAQLVSALCSGRGCEMESVLLQSTSRNVASLGNLHERIHITGAPKIARDVSPRGPISVAISGVQGAHIAPIPVVNFFLQVSIHS